MNPAPLSILYVEDNDALRETMALLLEEDDREIVLATSAEEAGRLCASRRFDLVVTDIGLPGRSGDALARDLLAVDPGRWIVLCSGRELEVDPRRLGPNVRVVGKPFDLEDLDRVIRQAAAARGR